MFWKVNLLKSWKVNLLKSCLESLLKPRSVAVQRGSQREKETQKQLEKELEAQDYIDQFYGQNNIEQDESIPNHVKETLYLALGIPSP